MVTGTGTGTAIPISVDQPINEDPLINSIKVSSAAIRIIRPKSQNVPLAKRRLLLRRDNNNNRTTSLSSGAQVIVTQYIEE